MGARATASPALSSGGRETAEQADLIFKTLASRPRREILRLLATGAAAQDERCCGSDEVCACVFSEKLGLGAPTVSHHMKALIDAGLVASDKRGSWVYYRLQPDAAQRISAQLTGLLADSKGCCG